MIIKPESVYLTASIPYIHVHASGTSAEMLSSAHVNNLCR